VVARYAGYVEKVPGVQGGEPVIAGTRTPVRTIVQMFKSAYPGNLSEIAGALPHLTWDQIEAALDYYQDHTAEIDAHIERHAVALKKLQAS
jgi:uncharacterized protein (DUF433 family)